MLSRIIERICAGFIADYGDTGAEVGGFITHSFLNTSHADIVVVDRNNEATLVEKALPGANTAEPGLIVKMTRFHPTEKSKQAGLHFNHALGNILGRISLVFQDTLNTHQKGFTKTPRGGITVCRRYFIPISRIENAKVLFEENTGLVLATGCDNYEMLVHPDSREYRTMNQNAQLYDNKPVGRMFEIVDTLRQHRERFVFVGNGVLRVDAVIDPSRADGLYVTEVQCKGGNRSSTVTVRYDFEEGYKKFGLYLSREEAETGGNPGLAAIRELEELRAKIAKEALESKQKEQVETRAVQSLETQQRMIDMQREHELRTRIGLESMETKRIQEDAQRQSAIREAELHAYSTRLKSSSETMRFIPAVIAGVVALVGGFALWKRS